MTVRSPALICLGVGAFAVLGVHLAHTGTGVGDAAFDAAFAAWFQPFVFLASGLVTSGRAAIRREGRLAWALVGAGLVLYAAGSILFNLTLAGGDAPFPSVADALWLSLYPLAGAGIALLVHRRLPHVNGMVWLDGAIGAAVIAAVAAALVFEPIFDITTANGAASVARLGYPLGDLGCLGFVLVVGCVCGRQLERFWILLGMAFALLALADSVYVVQAAEGTWAPGGMLDLPYALATMLLAAAAWAAPVRPPASREAETSRVVLPVIFAVAALTLAAYAVAIELNPLATALAFATLAAVVVRLGLALALSSRQSADLAIRAATDALTGLAHHRALQERLAREVERAARDEAPISVIALDVDHFKAINDHHGHSEGDRVLQSIGERLSGQLRPDDVAARVGGDEFIVLLPGVAAEAATTIAERCRATLSAISVASGPISCSAGVATYPDDAADGPSLLKTADSALYAAKRSGRSQVRRFDRAEDLLASEAERFDEVAALLREPAALTAHFQPIVEVATGRVGGYEALARFTAGAVSKPPNVWFAQARRCGLGDALEARALQIALSVPDRPAGTFLSLNVSPAALLSAEVAAVLPPVLDDIVIELTEDEMFSEDQELDLAIAALRDRGARIAIDDAGAGFAGLKQIIRIKPDILKLDRALIQGVDSDSSKIALLEALSRFAATTGSLLCGEGIETVEELRTAAGLDVTYAQGYALARPGPAWPAIDTAVVQASTAPAVDGMRQAGVRPGGPMSIGLVAEALAQLREPGELDGVMRMIESVASADDAAVSLVSAEGGFVETLSEHDWVLTNERFSLEDYPTTARVVGDQVPGQVVVGDIHADPAESRLLQETGFGALLMAPVVLRGRTVGLLELYRRIPRPYTATEIDQARVVAHQLGPVLMSRRHEASASPAVHD